MSLQSNEKTKRSPFSARLIPWRLLFIALLAVLGLSFMLAWVSSRFDSFAGWGAFLGVILLSAGIMFLGWRLIRIESPPRWLVVLLIAAFLLRVGAGAFWSLAMPLWGHGTPAEKAGYVMADASARDQLAWNLAASGKSLLTAFQDNRKVDQYGGLLFLSALIYRLAGGNGHYPLLMVVIAAAFSALAVLATWAFARRAWGEKEARLAAWIIALYPEAILLGSSQMREAFTITLTVAPFYGLLRYQQDHSRAGLAWMLAPLLLYLPFSPPFAAFLTFLLALTAFFTSGSFAHQLFRQRRLWLVLGLLILLAGAGLWLAVRQFAPDGMTNPFEVVAWWIKKSAGLQAYLTQHASGWMQKVFKQTPEGLHFPLLLVYGVVQPFLPAALMVGSHAAIWPWITLFRAIGWAFLLFFLIYAPLLALRQKEKNRFTLSITLVVWIGILVASFRGGGDLWDNPRYRATFAGLQAGIVAWAWLEHRRAADPWFGRALISAAAVVAWFLPWYLRRYTGFSWIIVDLFKTLGLGFATAILLVLIDLARTTKPRVPD